MNYLSYEDICESHYVALTIGATCFTQALVVEDISITARSQFTMSSQSYVRFESKSNFIQDTLGEINTQL